jgi:hypothetical protein
LFRSNRLNQSHITLEMYRELYTKSEYCPTFELCVSVFCHKNPVYNLESEVKVASCHILVYHRNIATAYRPMRCYVLQVHLGVTAVLSLTNSYVRIEKFHLCHNLGFFPQRTNKKMKIAYYLNRNM